MGAQKQREENKISIGRNIKRTSCGKREGEAEREAQRQRMVTLVPPFLVPKRI